MLFNSISPLPTHASEGFYLALLEAFTTSFASLVSDVVGLFTPREKVLSGRKQTNYAAEKSVSST